MQIQENELKLACEIIDKLRQMGLFSAEAPSDVDNFETDHAAELDDLGVNLFHGLTKIVIDYWHLENWVLKISLGNFKTDYMKLEYEMYQKAVTDGFDFLLAQTEMGTFLEDGRAFYFQERCICDEEAQRQSLLDYCSDNTEREPDESEEEWEDRVADNSYDLCDEEYCEAFLGQDYRSEVIDRFTSWCWDNDINDLHGGNFGQRADGTWCVVDYSGFH